MDIFSIMLYGKVLFIKGGKIKYLFTLKLLKL